MALNRKISDRDDQPAKCARKDASKACLRSKVVVALAPRRSPTHHFLVGVMFVVPLKQILVCWPSFFVVRVRWRNFCLFPFSLKKCLVFLGFVYKLVVL